MPTLEITPDAVTIRMSLLDRLVAFSGDVTIPRDRVLGARAVPNAVRAVDGSLGMPATRLPGLVMAGTIGSIKHGTTLAVTYGRKPGIVLDVRDPRFDHVVLTLEGADALAAELSAPTA